MSGSGSSTSSSAQREMWGRWGMKRNPYENRGSSTGRSTLSNGNVTMDPRINEIRESGVANRANLYNQLDEGGREIMGNLRGTRSRYEGNQSAYMDSQLNPVKQEYATRQGGLERTIGLRGLAGSSFGQQSMDSFSTEKNRGISDARAKAEFDQLSAVTGIDAQMAQTMFERTAQQAQLTGMDDNTAKAMIAQELAALGLGQGQTDAAMKAFAEFQQRRSKLLVQHDSAISATASGGSSGGDSIICTAMNEAYGFGEYRNKIWVKFGVTRMTNDHRLGYHFLFLPLVRYGFKSGDGRGKRIVRKVLEHIARHRTVDIRAVMNGSQRDITGMVYRALLEPTCRLFGFLIRIGVLNKAKGT